MYSLTMITGRLTRDPQEGKATGSGAVPVDFTVAVEEGFGDRKSVHYYNCTAWNKLGANVLKFQKKGSLVHVVGKMLSSKTEDRIFWKLRADDVVFLSSNNDKSQNQQQQSNSYAQNQAPQAPPPPPPATPYAQAPNQYAQQPQQGYQQQPSAPFPQGNQAPPPAPGMFAPSFPTDDDLPF